jgi:hypothetical protein
VSSILSGLLSFMLEDTITYGSIERSNEVRTSTDDYIQMLLTQSLTIATKLSFVRAEAKKSTIRVSTSPFVASTKPFPYRPLTPISVGTGEGPVGKGFACFQSAFPYFQNLLPTPQAEFAACQSNC